MPRAENRHGVVSNTSPIINLCKAGLLGLIEEMYSRVVVPTAVFKELTTGNVSRPDAISIQELVAHKALIVHPVKDRSLVRLIEQQLDRGEAEAIALAIELRAELILLDEMDARRIAEIFKLKKTGFIGILIAAEKAKMIPSAIHVLDQARLKGFWINDDFYQEIRRKLE
jgi:hypothetical protein